LQYRHISASASPSDFASPSVSPSVRLRYRNYFVVDDNDAAVSVSWILSWMAAVPVILTLSIMLLSHIDF